MSVKKLKNLRAIFCICYLATFDTYPRNEIRKNNKTNPPYCTVMEVYLNISNFKYTYGCVICPIFLGRGKAFRCATLLKYIAGICVLCHNNKSSRK